MKNMLVMLAILSVTVATAQNKVEKTVGEFQELKAYDLIEIELIKSNKNKVVITGKNTEDVVVVNKKGKLKIKMNLEESYDGDRTKVKLYYTNIDVIDANEGAKVFSKGKIKQFEIVLKAQEGGRIIIPLKVTTATIKSVSGGVIETSGKSDKQKVSLNTGGVYRGKDLRTGTTEIAIRAGGEADVNATDLVDIKIRAGGDVFIYGKPKKVNESRVIGGRIKHME